MSDLCLLGERQMAWVSPHFQLAHGVISVSERQPKPIMKEVFHRRGVFARNEPVSGLKR